MWFGPECALTAVRCILGSARDLSVNWWCAHSHLINSLWSIREFWLPAMTRGGYAITLWPSWATEQALHNTHTSHALQVYIVTFAACNGYTWCVSHIYLHTVHGYAWCVSHIYLHTFRRYTWCVSHMHLHTNPYVLTLNPICTCIQTMHSLDVSEHILGYNASNWCASSICTHIKTMHPHVVGVLCTNVQTIHTLVVYIICNYVHKHISTRFICSNQI
jgi:hypothetical protein